MTLDHGSPVEDVAWYPNGNLLVSVGGEDVCVWDAIGGGRLLRRLRSHQKTITTVHVHPDAGPPSFASGYEIGSESALESNAPRMITGSLDSTMKVWRVAPTEAVATLELTESKRDEAEAALLQSILGDGESVQEAKAVVCGGAIVNSRPSAWG